MGLGPPFYALLVLDFKKKVGQGPPYVSAFFEGLQSGDATPQLERRLLDARRDQLGLDPVENPAHRAELQGQDCLALVGVKSRDRILAQTIALFTAA